MRKTNKSIAKRFKVTGSGKLMRRTPGRRHLLRKKSTKQKRASRKDKELNPAMVSAIKVGLPFAF